MRLALIFSVLMMAAPSIAEAPSKQALDVCEAKLRACYRECWAIGTQTDKCSTNCSTSRCDIDLPQQSIVDFLRWRRTKGRITI
jgi:hypothetical protein